MLKKKTYKTKSKILKISLVIIILLVLSIAVSSQELDEKSKRANEILVKKASEVQSEVNMIEFVGLIRISTSAVRKGRIITDETRKAIKEAEERLLKKDPLLIRPAVPDTLRFTDLSEKPAGGIGPVSGSIGAVFILLLFLLVIFRKRIPFGKLKGFGKRFRELGKKVKVPKFEPFAWEKSVIAKKLGPAIKKYIKKEGVNLSTMAKIENNKTKYIKENHISAKELINRIDLIKSTNKKLIEWGYKEGIHSKGLIK